MDPNTDLTNVPPQFENGEKPSFKDKLKSLLKRRSVQAVILLWLLFFIGVGSVIGIFEYTANGGLGPLPTIEQLENPETAVATNVYAADGVLLGKYYSENRSPVQYKDLPQNLIDALIATEDVRFYKHAGIDARGLGRALYGMITFNPKGGASTITQQLATNLFHERPREITKRIKQKLKEQVIAVRLESRYTKEEIIAMYLNTVDFVNNAYGIKAAAKTYFNKTPDSLTVEESAVFVGMLKAPSTYHPNKKDQTVAINRRNTVLNQMVRYNYLDKEVADSLKKQPIVLDFKAESHIEGPAPYFREHLRLEVKNLLKEKPKSYDKDGNPIYYDVYQDGLKVYTTIDHKMQEHAEMAVREHLSELQQEFFKHWKDRDPWKYAGLSAEFDKVVKRTEIYRQLKASGMSKDSIEIVLNNPREMKVFSWDGEIDTTMSPIDSIRYHRMFLQTGFSVVDPKTGHVKAWVGGIDYKYFQYDHVKSNRQIGSTFKPFLYATAIDNGYSPCFRVRDVRVVFEDYKNWSPDNSDGKFTGELLTLKKCLEESTNSCSAYLIKQIGPEPVIAMARKLGIKSHIDPYPSICLGTPDLTLKEMVGAYTAFANKGIYTKPTFVTRIEDKNGNVIVDYLPERYEALSEQTAYIMVEMLRNVVQHGTAIRLRLPSYPYQLKADIGGKTGTTQEHADGWFMGITPELVGGVWVGGEDRQVRFRSIRLGQGANMALPIWALFFKKLYEDPTLGYSQDTRFPEPKFKLSIELDCSKYEVDDPGDFEETGSIDAGEYGSEWD